ncbi:LITAF domain-containing protein [Caenorhabditis elegans]|uniref:LITAF domain-containing protein n=1 Tax=Caenorhabditis elegans TaxID=6239 RepID=G5EGQ9_CAEEL|nr:LITAF domain-containing protein [Caenorhabditis elegans]AAK01101.2 NMDA-type ionotropic glutamate receptor NMR-1 [Caenorhabditis elegans]CCD68749.1 LITAF domain-containing protein [Caenorhabditis elegans]|eukprot:NP_495033.2 NMDA class glutamate Receptor [Caenorhabditis elegans]
MFRISVIFIWIFLQLGYTIDYKVSVLIVSEPNQETFKELKVSVTAAFVEVFGSTSYHLGNDTISAAFVDAKSGDNRLELTQDIVCSQMLNHSLASVIFSPLLTSSSRFIDLVTSSAYTLSFYKLPVVGVMVRDAEFSKKNIYPTFVRPTAPLSDEAFVFLHMLLSLKYRQVVVLSVKRDINADQFVEEFEKRRVEFKIIVQRYIEVELNENLNDTLAESFEEVTSNIIVLFAKKDDAVRIFANAGDLTGKGKVWIVSESAGEAHNVPNGSLGCRLGQTAFSVLRDSFSILKSAMETIFRESKIDIFPPVECDRDSVDAEWNSLQAPALLNEICGTSTSRVHFNDKCERIGVEYDIINFHMERKQVGNMVGDILRLDEDSIEWAGGTKPLEISLPKHLRVVTVADPPFVYTTPIGSPSQCAELGNTVVEWSIFDKIVVSGPWYSCPLTLENSTEYFCCAGLAIDLLSNLSLPEANNSIDTSFTFSLHLNESYGVVQASETTGITISGVIGELDGDTADMAIGGITINPERERIVDFTEPWLYHGIRILEKNIPRDSPMQSFLQPLQSSLWTALFISVILVGLAIYCLDFKSPFERFYQADKEMEQDLKKEFELWIGKDADENVNFGEAMWFVWGVLLNSGVSEKTPRSCSARVLGIVWCGFCMIMVASYTANLAAFLVLDQPEKGLTGVTDPRLRNPSANFSFGTVLNSNVYQYFKRHVELSSMFRKMEPHNVRRASEAVHSLLNGSLDAFIWDSTRLEFEAARHCELRTRGSLFGRSAYGIGLQKNSPWTPHITSAILRMSESGVMEKLDQKWIDRGGPNCVVEAHKSPARLGLVNMKDIFILVSSGVALGIFLSFVEVSYGRRLADKGRRRRIVTRYFQKWHDLTLGKKRRPYRLKYNLDRMIVRRGFSGLERCSFQELRERRQIRGLPTSKVDPYCFWPDLDFKDKPLVLFCSRCRNIVESDVHRETGLFAFLSCFLFAILFLWPCSPLPCFLSSFSDFVHICPLCSHIMGRFRRARSTRFYV